MAKVRHYYHREGDRRFLPQWELDLFVENVLSLRRQDCTFIEIARKLRVGRQTIRQRLIKANALEIAQAASSAEINQKQKIDDDTLSFCNLETFRHRDYGLQPAFRAELAKLDR